MLNRHGATVDTSRERHDDDQGAAHGAAAAGPRVAVGMSGGLRTALATIAAGRDERRCTPRTKRCDFWARGGNNARPPCCTAHMVELATFVDELLTRHGILHWIDYGTLLGAVREGQLI